MATTLNAPGGRASPISPSLSRLSLDLGLVDIDSLDVETRQPALPPVAGMTARQAAALVPQAALDRVYPGSGTRAAQEKWADPGELSRDNLTPEGYLRSLRNALPALANMIKPGMPAEQAAPIRMAGRILDAHVKECELSAANRLALIAA